MNKKRIAVFTAILAFINLSIFAQFIDVKKDANGWRLMEGRKEIEVKGIVWSYTPIGETHTYDLWSKSDEFIERMIDTDMPLLKAMGMQLQSIQISLHATLLLPWQKRLQKNTVQ